MFCLQFHLQIPPKLTAKKQMELEQAGIKLIKKPVVVRQLATISQMLSFRSRLSSAAVIVIQYSKLLCFKLCISS